MVVWHFWLGAALLLAPVCAWIAIRGAVLVNQPLDILPAAWLGLAMLLWVASFDIIYACQDVQYDIGARLRSIPAVLGVLWSLRLSAVCHFFMIVVLFGLPLVDRCGGPTVSLGLLYWIGTAAVAVLLVYEHWIVRPDDLTRVNVAFFHLNAIVSVGLFIVATVDLLV